MDARTALSEHEGSAALPFKNWESWTTLDILETRILYEVWALGQDAYHGAIQRAVSAGMGYRFHKQNFRRIVENLAERGLLVEFECKVTTTGGRPATRRYMLTEAGESAARDYCEQYRALVGCLEKIGEIIEEAA